MAGKLHSDVRFEVSTAKIQVEAFWVVVPCSQNASHEL